MGRGARDPAGTVTASARRLGKGTPRLAGRYRLRVLALLRETRGCQRGGGVRQDFQVTRRLLIGRLMDVTRALIGPFPSRRMLDCGC